MEIVLNNNQPHLNISLGGPKSISEFWNKGWTRFKKNVTIPIILRLKIWLWREIQIVWWLLKMMVISVIMFQRWLMILIGKLPKKKSFLFWIMYPTTWLESLSKREALVLYCCFACNKNLSATSLKLILISQYNNGSNITSIGLW